MLVPHKRGIHFQLGPERLEIMTGGSTLGDYWQSQGATKGQEMPMQVHLSRLEWKIYYSQLYLTYI